MDLQNCIGIETRHGYRTFELYFGDLTEPEAAADLLVVSSFAGDYQPLPGTLLGAIHESLCLDVREVGRDLDLRDQLGFWLSAPIKEGHFKRLLGVEIVGGRLSIGDAIANIFIALAIADAKGFEIRTVALPLLGAGHQAISPDESMGALLPAVRKALEQNYSLQRILLVDKDKERVGKLSTAMNQVLGRAKVQLPKGQLIGSIRSEIRASLDALRAQGVIDQYPMLHALHTALGQEAVRSFEIGVLARRLAELVVNHYLGRPATHETLATRIGRLREVGIASWVQSYLHTLRHFGNDSAHEVSRAEQKPPYVGEDDMAVCLFCMQRVLEFWAFYRT